MRTYERLLSSICYAGTLTAIVCLALLPPTTLDSATPSYLSLVSLAYPHRVDLDVLGVSLDVKVRFTISNSTQGSRKAQKTMAIQCDFRVRMHALTKKPNVLGQWPCLDGKPCEEGRENPDSSFLVIP